MKKSKKLIATMLMLTMTASMLAGCGKKGGEEVKTDTQVATEAPAEEPMKEEVVTLKWVTVGGSQPSNYEAWQTHVNEMLEEKIGVNIDVEVVSWGDWDSRRSVIVNGGEYFDILFTDSGKYTSEVAVGAFMDITELLPKVAPELYKYIPEDYWKAVSVNNKIYSVPTYKDSSATWYLVWDKAVAEKNGVDYKNIHSFKDLEPALEKIKDGEGTAPFIMNKSGVKLILDVYDQMGAGFPCLGVKYDDNSRTVVNPLEQEDILSQLDVVHSMYKKGLINGDAPNAEQIPDYRMVFTAQGWSGAAKTVWGPNMGGIDAEAIQLGDTMVNNTTVRGSLNAIYSGTKYPEKCLEFLQLINTDSKIRDAFFYGLEGENFNYTADGKVEKINNEWPMAGYTQGTFFQVSQLADVEFNQWDEVKQLNEQAKPSVLLGFTLDTANIETELANCRSIYEKYEGELFTGAKEPREMVKKISEELKAAGYDKVVEETQKQINEAFQ